MITIKTKVILKITCSLLLFSLIYFKSKPLDNKNKKPNVVIILTDDQGWGDLSLTGNPNLSTPNIDKLAREGAFFKNFYVNPVCSPTRAELLTGRYAIRGGVYSTSEGGERLDLDETTIADIFKKNGYNTGAFGKWHSGSQYPYHPNGRGFDEFYGFCSGHWGNYFNPMLDHNGSITKGKGFIADDITNHAINFIEDNKEQPFLLYIPYNTPHSPMQVPDVWWNKFKDKNIKIDHRYSDIEDLEHTKAAYALCENIDWNVGRIEDKLKSLGLEENTIVIFLSDNGPNGWRWNANLKGKKGDTDEGGTKSPFIIKWKDKITEGFRTTNIYGTIDILPSLIDIADLKAESTKPLDGISLKPELFGEAKITNNRHLVTHWKGRISVRHNEFLLDENDKLYNIIKDPNQKNDISEAHTVVHKKMLSYKEGWKNSVLTELPKEDLRTLPVGHPEYHTTHLPARDAKAYGNIKRSNRWPNDSFYTNWTSIKDSITWDVDVLKEGSYKAIIYYTCSEENLGSEIELRSGTEQLKTVITEPFDPPFVNVEKDRVKRQESYVKAFKPLNMGTITLKKGQQKLTLKALTLKNKQVLDFRLLVLNNLSSI